MSLVLQYIHLVQCHVKSNHGRQFTSLGQWAFIFCLHAAVTRARNLGARCSWRGMSLMEWWGRGGRINLPSIKSSDMFTIRWSPHLHFFDGCTVRKHCQCHENFQSPHRFNAARDEDKDRINNRRQKKVEMKK